MNILLGVIKIFDQFDRYFWLRAGMVENLLYFNELGRPYKMGIVVKVIVFPFGTMVLKGG
ncbi:hypothetical protein BTJ40_09580 [Microbulbifer sp. A4B17]|nr:hypothetical protein BTJ40_09580 [Microbulbifer sp. A4B17]